MKLQSVKRNDLLHVCTRVDMLLGSKQRSYCDVVKKILSGRTKEPVKGPLKKTNNSGWVTLDWWKLYLDICANYYATAVESYLINVHKEKTTLWGSCNVGVTITSMKGLLLGIFDMWINTHGIKNLLQSPNSKMMGFVSRMTPRRSGYCILQNVNRLYLKETRAFAIKRPI